MSAEETTDLGAKPIRVLPLEIFNWNKLSCPIRACELKTLPGMVRSDVNQDG